MRMLNKSKWVMLSLFIGFLVSVNQAYAVSQSDPKKMVLELSNKVLKEIDLNRDQLESSSEKVKAFANELVLPYVDTPKMARYVMGGYWKKATKSQQKAFVEAFTNTLLQSYSKSLLKLKIKKIEVDSAIETHKGRVQVSTEVWQDDGNKTKVDYRVYLNKALNKWFLYDVSIEGISMLLNYRKTFASEFQKNGIDEVIALLNKKNMHTEEES